MKRLVAGVAIAAILTAVSCSPTSLIANSTRAASIQLAPARTVTAADIVATAQRYLGSSYATIGDSPSTGFSCIGFVHFVFAQNGVNVPYDIPLAWNSAPHVAFNDLMPGDVLFFSNTVFAGLSHVAIYIGNGQMIGADSFAVGVTTDNLNAQYWIEHYTGATRPLALVGSNTTTTAPAQPAATDTPTPTATTAPKVVASAPVGTRLQPLSTTVGVYSGPGYQYTSLGILTPSTLLTVVQEQDGWYDVSFQDAHMVEKFGWVNAADVKSTAGDTQTPANAPANAVTATPTPTDTATPQPSPTPPFSRAAAATGGATGITLMVVAGPLNVRSGPGKQFAPVGSVKKGAHLSLLEQRAGWDRVATATGLSGWVASQYVAPLGATPQQLDQAEVTTAATPRGVTTIGTARVIASVLNVRTAPNDRARVISVLFAGEVVPVLQRTNGWDEVQLHSGTIGWASAKWLSGQ